MFASVSVSIVSFSNVSAIFDEHRDYVTDFVRLEAYESAISSLVRPGDVVLDLASGTGILGLFACRAGASRLYSVELGGVIDLARKISAENGFADRTTFLKGVSTGIELPEQVDVVIADQVGYFGFGAGIVEFFSDAVCRFLKPGGRTIPGSIDLHMALLEAPELLGKVEQWASNRCGFDFTSVREIASNNIYTANLTNQELLSSPTTLGSIDLAHSSTKLLRGEMTMNATRTGTVHGLGGWFTAHLAPGITMTNSPVSDARIQRPQVYLPLREPMPVKAGDSISVQISITLDDDLVTWTLVDPSNGRVFRHSTFKGLLLPEEDLLRSRPDFIPRLNSDGVRRHAVLSLCDGSRSRQEIIRTLVAAYPKIFPTVTEASVVVAQVFNNYVV